MIEALSEKDTIIKLISIGFLLVISGFFSGSETALTAASKARVKARAEADDKRVGIVAKLLDSKERLIGALLLGNNLVNILASALMTGLALSLFGPAGVAYATIVMTALVLVFAEVLPKTYAITRPNKVALAVARPVSVVVWLFAPIVHVVQIFVNLILRSFGVKPEPEPLSAAEEIRGTVEIHIEEGGMAKRARDQIFGVLTIGDLTVEDVMVHRKNVDMVDADLPTADIVNAVLNSSHTRLPVWRGDKDNVIGVLHAKDLLKAIGKADGDLEKIKINRIVREPWFVPETTPVVTQLRAFQQKREHFALAVDEYGALMGVVTLEDILEEIVGDIKDEFDPVGLGIRKQKDGSYVVRGDVPVRDLNRALDWDLPDDHAVTLAGLIIHESQTIPEVGRVFNFHGHRFEILNRKRNQITSIRVLPENGS